MNVTRKDATITNTDTDDAFPGSFEVVLSAPTKDRDGDTLRTSEWKLPLPDHITFDTDHGMSVAATVGSGTPRIDGKSGNLVVTGTYSSLPRAQEVRTLVKEGHINRTSVAFMTEKTQKDGRSTVVRELLNGAFVAVPSNREAVILDSKGMKAGARNSAADAEHIQAIHDHAIALGATPAAAGEKGYRPAVEMKAVAGSYEQAQRALSDALSIAYPSSDDDKYVYAYPVATFPTTVVYRVSGSSDAVGQWQADYTTNDDGTVTLGTPTRVNLVEQIVPLDGDPEKAPETADDPEPAAAAKAAAADTGKPAADDDDSKQVLAAAARLRLYATLTEGD